VPAWLRARDISRRHKLTENGVTVSWILTDFGSGSAGFTVKTGLSGRYNVRAGKCQDPG